MLFITQKIDQNDSVLGVYHEWVKRLAGKVDKVSVICLFQGRVDLPAGVRVLSLGKEMGESRLKYLLNFYKYIFKLRNDYDLVFVHMNPGYIWLGWKFWRLWGKKIVYWNASYKVSWFMKSALILADRGVTSIPEAFVKSKKVVAVGQGIDIELFRRDRGIFVKPNSILYLGRISPVKNLDILIEAAKILSAKKIDFKLSIVGSPDPADRRYFEKIKEQSAYLEKSGAVSYISQISHGETPRFFNSHKIFVNLTESNSFDKSILESMSCETLILVSNRAYARILGDELKNMLMFEDKNPADLAQKMEILLKVTNAQSTQVGLKLREIVVKNHSLNDLPEKLVKVFKEILS